MKILKDEERDWTRFRLFRRRSGRLSFRQIEALVLQSRIGDSRGRPSRRVALKTREGDVPPTVTYDAGDAPEEVATRIRRILDATPDGLVEDSARAMVRQGRIVEAVRLLQAGEDLSLTAARARVREIQGDENGPDPA